MSDLCPGSGTQPVAAIDREKSIRRGKVMVDCYGTCGHCGRDYYITSKGVIHIHRGLPPRPGGGCPYRCSHECDFNCYHEREVEP